MVGQYKLISSIDKLILENKFPRTLLLEGSFGCGKHTVVKYISNKLDLEIVDMTEELNLEFIEQVMLNPIPRIYLIDCSSISIKEQNVILKFLEEPLKNSFIILLCENRELLLQTVVNRCYCLMFEGYNKKELEIFLESSIDNSSKELVLLYSDTPGRVLQLQVQPLKEIVDLCKKIFLQIHKASYSNILTIPDKISFKQDDDNKFNFSVFRYILIYVASNLYKENQINFEVYELTSNFYKDCYISNINKQQLFEHWLFELKQVFERG